MVIAHKAQEKSPAYAVGKDFCRIFEQDMNRLYLLAYLLTGQQALAERCFATALQGSARSPRVFKEWAYSWARRMVVQSAIETVAPHAGERSEPQSKTGHSGECVEIAAVLDLPVFDRFVFVMSVLERYSDHDCALLLGCSRSEVIAARIRALQQMGSAAEAHRVLQGSEQPSPQRVRAFAARVESIPHFATLP